jgi:histidinol-phosphate phosphatase family protein
LDNNELQVGPDWTLFLDRDGVINKRLESYVTNWESFSFIEGVPKAIAECSDVFGRIFVVTNQQGIGKELMTHEDLEDIHNKMIEVIDYFGGRIDNVYYEPSLAVYEAFGRKPNPGMAIAAKEDYPSIEFAKSIMVGDTLSDMQFGKAVGMKTCWIRNQWEMKNYLSIKEFTDIEVSHLGELLQKILK